MGQSPQKRYEVAFQAPLLHLGTFDTTELGLGGRMTFNLNEWLALEGEGSFFPNDQGGLGGRKSQVLGGAKAGIRLDRVGLFAKTRSGILHFSELTFWKRGVVCPAVFPPPPGCLEQQAKTRPVVDLGGAFEFYPSRTSFLRLDLGDLLVHYDGDVRDRVFLVDEDLRSVGKRPDGAWNHNFQFGASFGVHF